MKDSKKYLSTESLMLGLMANMSEYDVKFINGENPYTIRIDGDDVYVYIKNLSPAQLSNNNPDIWRVQLPVKDSFNRVKNSDLLFILLGYDAENDVYTSWNPYWCKQRLNVGKSVSLYSRYSLQQRVHKSGEIEKLSLNNESDVVCFPAKLLYQYIKSIKDYFPTESLYIAKGSRINKRIEADPQVLYDLFISFEDCSKFETYMRSQGVSDRAISDYIRNLRVFQINGYFDKYKALFLRCSSIADYDEAIKEFRNQPDVLAIDEKQHGYLRAALRHYVRFMKTLLLRPSEEQTLFENPEPEPSIELDEFGKLIQLDPELIKELSPFIIGEDYPDYDEMITRAAKFYPGDIDANMAYSDWIALFKKTNWKKTNHSKDNKTEFRTTVRRRSHNKIRVIWPDGRSMQSKKDSDTLVYVIEHNYPDLIIEMDFGRDVISKVPFPDFPSGKRSQRFIQSGYWINTNNDIQEKVKILKQISDELDLGLVVEITSIEKGGGAQEDDNQSDGGHTLADAVVKMEDLFLQDHFSHWEREAIKERRKEISDILVDSRVKGDIFWSFVNLLLNINSRIYRKPIADFISGLDRIDDYRCSAETLSHFVEVILSDEDKIQQGLSCLLPFKEILPEEVFPTIVSVSSSLNTTAGYELLFNVIDASIKERLAIVMQDRSLAALFTLYGLMKNYKDSTAINHKKAKDLLRDLRLGFAEDFTRRLVLQDIFGQDQGIDSSRIADIHRDGFVAFQRIVYNHDNRIVLKERQRKLHTLKGQILSFKVYRSTKNHYHLTANDGFNALLPKRFSNNTLQVNQMVSCFVIETYPISKLMLVSQWNATVKDVSSIPIIDIGEEVIVRFRYSNSVLTPSIAGYSLVQPTIINKIKGFNFKKKYIARVVNSTFIKCDVQLLREYNN